MRNPSIKLRNKLARTDVFSRCMRVFDDDAKEYYDVLISSGTSGDTRDAIANNAHVLSGYYDFYEDFYGDFEWTRVAMYNRGGRKEMGDLYDVDGIDYMSDIAFYFNGEQRNAYYSTNRIDHNSVNLVIAELTRFRPDGKDGVDTHIYARTEFNKELK